MTARGQSSFEFLLTYGWAFFILGIVLSALFATGILDFGSLMPERCAFFGQINCKEFQLKTNSATPPVGTFQMIVGNDFGVDLVIKNGTLTDGMDLVCTSVPKQLKWAKGSYLELNYSGCTGKNVLQGNRITLYTTLHFYRNSTCPNGATSSCVYMNSGTLDGQIK